MVDEDEFNKEVKEDQKILVKKQKEFEVAEKERIENKDEFESIEFKKNKRISWAVIIAMFVFILILGLILL